MVVVVSAPHRAEAFEAGRFAIDALKASVPIWKHEVWRDGADWGTGAQPIADVPRTVVVTVGRRHRRRSSWSLLVVIVVLTRRSPPRPDGVASFRRQIDALVAGGPATGRRSIDAVATRRPGGRVADRRATSLAREPDQRTSTDGS